jgi:hypothetical protein
LFCGFYGRYSIVDRSTPTSYIIMQESQLLFLIFIPLDWLKVLSIVSDVITPLIQALFKGDGKHEQGEQG